MIKESITKKAQSDENLQEFFGMFGSKKKAQPKAKAGASKSSGNQEMLNKIFNKGRSPDKKKLLIAFKENPEAYVNAVRLAAKGIKGAQNRNAGQVEEYLKYIQTLNKFISISDTIHRKPRYITIFSTTSKKSALGLLIFIVYSLLIF